METKTKLLKRKCKNFIKKKYICNTTNFIILILIMSLSQDIFITA